MDYEFYLDYYESFKHSYELDHCGHPSLNLHNEYLNPADVEALCKKEFEYSFGLYNVLWAGEEPLDYAKYLISLKTEWLRQFKKLEPKKRKHAARSELLRLKKGTDDLISLKMLKYVQHMKTDPVPGMLGHRNWLFSGGTVASLDADGENSTIVVCGGRHLSTLWTLKLNNQGMVANADDFDLQYDEPILQVSTNQDSRNLLVCTRQQHCANVLEKNGCLYTRVLRKILSQYHFFTSSGMKDEILALSKNDGTIALYDVAVKEEILKLPYVHVKGDCPVENVWNQIHWLEDKLWITNKKSIYQLDGRETVNNCDFTDSLELCDEFRSMFLSPGNTSAPYIFTTHSLLQIDLRSKKILKKWSHMLSRPPDFGGVVQIGGGEELVVLQSCDAEEVVAIVNSPEAALLPPRLVPSPADTFREAKLNLVCLDPVVRERPSFSVIGALLLPVKDGCHQITQNAGGDVFLRKIRKGDGLASIDPSEEDENKAWETWREYEETCQEMSLAVAPVYSAIDDATAIFNELKMPCDVPQTKPKRTGNPKWRLMRHLRVQELPNYKDFMAKRVVDVWDVKEHLQKRPQRRQYQEIELSDSEDEEMEAIERVSGWLEDQVQPVGERSPPLWQDG